MSMNESERLIERVQNAQDREKERDYSPGKDSLLSVFLFGGP